MRCCETSTASLDMYFCSQGAYDSNYRRPRVGLTPDVGRRRGSADEQSPSGPRVPSGRGDGMRPGTSGFLPHLVPCRCCRQTDKLLQNHFVIF